MDELLYEKLRDEEYDREVEEPYEQSPREEAMEDIYLETMRHIRNN